MTSENETSLYEIVELDNGEVALRRADGSGTPPLVTIKFSEESRYYLEDAKFDIAKVMIEAGLDAVGEMTDEPEQEQEHENEKLMELAAESNLLH